MTVNRTGVCEAQLFEDRFGLDQVVGLLLKAFCQSKQGRCISQHLLAHFFGFCIKATRHQLGQVLIQGAYGWTDRHVVVVQDDQQIAIAGASIVHRFVRHAGGQRAIAYDGDRFSLTTCLFSGHGHAKGRRNTSG